MMYLCDIKQLGILDKVPAIEPKYLDLRDGRLDCQSSRRDLAPPEDFQNKLFTHGYVHGHVHQHKDHLHIHGHIHNHDHELQAQPPQVVPAEDLNACKEMNNFDLCDDIYCDDLDDCYYHYCDNDNPSRGDRDVPGAPQAECCDDPKCLADVTSSICTDPVCTGNERHDNSLCDSQNSKLGIFESLIQNVLKNIEQYSAPSQPSQLQLQLSQAYTRRADFFNENTASNPDFQIHFPHHCHLDNTPLADDALPSDLFIPSLRNFEPDIPVLEPSHMLLSSSHTLHHSCFHAKLPASMAEPTFLSSQKTAQSDYDFFVQFDNLNSIGPDTGGPAPVAPKDEEPAPNYVQPCQWEQCFEQVHDSALFDHVFNSHIKKEYQLDHGLSEFSSSQPSSFGCEWNDCGFVETDLKVFLHHLYTHTAEPDVKPAPPVPASHAVTVLTPSSIESCNDMSNFELGPPMPMHDRTQRRENDFNITRVKICPKRSASQQVGDGDFSCKWQLGTGLDGEPIICNKTHSDDGALQNHLQRDHIGFGKATYQCCWYGCERNGGKKFTQRQKVYRHIHMHTGYKPCVCETCGLRFAVPAMLKQHQRMHLGEKPYTCTICGKAFSTSSALGIHNRTHSGVKPSQCTWPGCGRKFNERSNFHKHLKVHTRLYKCDVCQEECQLRKDLNLHKKRAHLV